ncbi:hypothetical protein AOE58_01090 [Candidatus Riesia pthiripubis]|uniref:YciK family oxidoreductase n=1 Tax=Candidatus Riesia pthiripubis TaxID=428412 RepID=A0A1V0HP74_9ENTR|nr:hypothetical protein AOE58_01090 [Candidatus Riesia pthiripubis]
MNKYRFPKKKILNKKTILVTGASDGIGKTASIYYARYGADLILLGRNLNKLQQIKTLILEKYFYRVKIQIFEIDLININESKCFYLVKSIKNNFSHINGILHNASILGESNPIINYSSVVWQNVFKVNIYATFLLTKFLLPLILESVNGSIILTSSNVVKKGKANFGAYTTSKFATEGFMKVLHEEYRHSSIRVNCINPGRVRTKMRITSFQNEKKKLFLPKEIMPVYLYLMSDESIKDSGKVFNCQELIK